MSEEVVETGLPYAVKSTSLRAALLRPEALDDDLRQPVCARMYASGDVNPCGPLMLNLSPGAIRRVRQAAL
ncbi:MAG TPA: hypothetical protein VKZ41_09905 [Gemmatimonadales bacterium]|nr:hypothetical protein [Gemmatimonadales bacterium]